MQAAAAYLVGRHDFASFQAAGSAVRATVRTIHRLDVREDGGEIVVEVDGDGFLRHMVRAIVGTLADVGAGLRPPAVDGRDTRRARSARRRRDRAGLAASRSWPSGYADAC